MDRFRKHLTFANVVSLIALFVALGGTAMAAVIITDNSQVAQDTISGHHPPTGKHSNLIAGSVNGQDVDNNSVTGSDVKQGSLTGLDIQDRSGVDTCQTPLTAQFGPILGAGFVSARGSQAGPSIWCSLRTATERLRGDGRRRARFVPNAPEGEAGVAERASQSRTPSSIPPWSALPPAARMRALTSPPGPNSVG